MLDLSTERGCSPNADQRGGGEALTQLLQQILFYALPVPFLVAWAIGLHNLAKLEYLMLETYPDEGQWHRRWRKQDYLATSRYRDSTITEDQHLELRQIATYVRCAIILFFVFGALVFSVGLILALTFGEKPQ